VENIPHTPLNRLAPYPTWFICLPLEGRAYSVLGWRIWLHRPPKWGAYSQPRHTYLLVTVVLDIGLLVSGMQLEMNRSERTVLNTHAEPEPEPEDEDEVGGS
jgi:hypothetical protein